MAALLVLLRVLHTNSDRRLALDMYAATTPLGEHVRIILIGPGLDAPFCPPFRPLPCMLARDAAMLAALIHVLT